MRPPFTVEPMQQGAKERVSQRLKDIAKINQERPCSKCFYYARDKSVKCATTSCDFYHSAFKPNYDQMGLN